MGYYFEAPIHQKAQELLNLGAKEVSLSDAAATARGTTHGVFCVVDNGIFDAAAFCFSPQEFEAFTRPDDPRPKRFFSLPRSQAEALVGYKPPSPPQAA